ncbi:P2Y purinoceptor 8-like [Acipenser oxyrinchus oxyrinchus]|uniref:P2Y purinoceptor 8-like n=1 Tax=Acipenser oxyrinchus oxyrinchus TaxID=40147 RepID=A0AAD8G8U8_ACIOX|nr:P2Y purinoceptor 8-like [Acipenser oxyrinchus oxyrinchus]
MALLPFTMTPRGFELPNYTTANTTSTLSPDILEMITSKTLTVALPVIYLVVFIISIPLNTISLWLLCCHTKRNNPTIIYAINLSLTDLLYSAFLPFQIIYHLNGNNWPFGDIVCRISIVAFYGNMYCSVLTTCAISLERYWGIVQPLQTKHWRTSKVAVITCISIWLVVLITHVLVLYKDFTFSIEDLNITTCFDIFPKNLFKPKITGYLYFAVPLIFFLIIPLIVVIVCYTSIIKTLKDSPNTETHDSKKQTMYLILVVVLCFIVCYLPNILLQILHMIYKSRGKSLYVYYKLCLGINSLNCCFDPFVYYFASKDFRCKLQKKLCCCLPDAHDEQTTSNLSELARIPITGPELLNRDTC